MSIITLSKAMADSENSKVIQAYLALLISTQLIT